MSTDDGSEDLPPPTIGAGLGRVELPNAGEGVKKAADEGTVEVPPAGAEMPGVSLSTEEDASAATTSVLRTNLSLDVDDGDAGPVGVEPSGHAGPECLPLNQQPGGRLPASTASLSAPAGPVITSVPDSLPLPCDPGRVRPRGGEEPSWAAVEREAIATGRFSLAYYAAVEIGDAPRAETLRSLVLAEGLRTGTGQVASALIPILGSLSGQGVQDRGAMALTLAAALRAAVYLPAADLLGLLAALRSNYLHHPGTTLLLDVVQQALRTGATVASASASLRENVQYRDAVVAASKAAAAELREGQYRTIKFVAATKVWSKWMREDGLLGSLLRRAADDDSTAIAEVSARVATLRDRDRLVAEMRATDGRPTRRNEITAGARDRLLDWANGTLDLVAVWVDAALAAELARRSKSQADGGLVLRLQTAAQEAGTPEMLRAAEGDNLNIACQRAAADSIARTLEVYRRGADAYLQESSSTQILTDDLLLAPGPCIGTRGPVRAPELGELTEALKADPRSPGAWETAYRSRSNALDHAATARVVEIVSALDLRQGDRLGAERALDLEGARQRMRVEVRAMEDRVASARSRGHLSDADWSRISGALLGCDPTDRVDLGAVRATLAELANDLDNAYGEALASLRQRIVLVRGARPTRVKDIDLIGSMAAAGDITTAEEYLALVFDDSEIPKAPPPRDEFDRWWPGFARQLGSQRVDRGLVAAVKERRRIGPLDFSQVSSSELAIVAEGLEAWAHVATGKPKGQLIQSVKPFLPLLGIEVTDLESVAASGPARADREWRRLIGFSRTGRAMVPDFGSHSSGAATGETLLCLLVWNSPRANAVASYLAEEASSRPVMVWYFGILTADERVAFADAIRGSARRRPVVVIDDGLLLFLATQIGPDYETIMRLTLPFAAVNPYHSVGGLTPVEMFYGRGTERSALGDLTRSALVYGGRQLGKSSLLRAAERDFDDGRTRRAVYIDLKANGIGTVRPPDAIWALLWRSLAHLGVFVGEPPASQIGSKVHDGVISWLDAREGRQLLVLLDECDLFLGADAENRLDTVDALDHLMTEAHRRIKFVFAGLHRVQRLKPVENQPLAHLGQPIAVGPLRSHEALALVVEPASALGYRFENEQLPARILAICNNNPGLLVLFMEALLDRMLGRPLRRPGIAAPPVVITEGDVEATYTNASLAELIKERFELTLDLDHAYKVITYTVASEAIDRGPGVELSVRELRDMASAWWPRGFASLSHDGFRATCDELVDLGVLANRNGNYGLRSPNILRFLGTAEQILEVLGEVEQFEPSPSFDPASARPRLKGNPDIRSPLSNAQLADLVAPKSQVRLVLGSDLSGINRVPDAIRGAAEDQTTVEAANPSNTRLGSFRNTSGHHRLVLVDLRGVGTKRSVELVADALETRRSGSGTLGVVFFSDPTNIELWRLALEGGDLWDRVGIVEIGRVGSDAWRYWISDAELPFAGDSSADDLLRASGGWLGLLEPSARVGRGLRKKAFEEMDRQVAADRAPEVLARAGLDRRLLRAFREVCKYYPTGAESSEVAEAARIADSDAIDVLVLRTLGVLTAGPSGLVPEPLMAALAGSVEMDG